MPKYAPLIISEAWKCHLQLEEVVRQGLMMKESDNFTLLNWHYGPGFSRQGRIKLLIKESERDETMD